MGGHAEDVHQEHATRESSTGFLRDPPQRENPPAFFTARAWLERKALTDGAEGLWRVHDTLYDLSGFAERHPGGAEWILMTRGTDITEAFECSHPDIVRARTLLAKYAVRAAALDAPRNSTFTFKQGGFYDTLRARCWEALKDVPGGASGASFKMRFIHDSTLFFFLAAFLRGCMTGSLVLLALAGFTLGVLCIQAHNFFHKKDNWRMYSFDLSGLSSFEWRISHGLSHHYFPNTIADYEVEAFEPFLLFLPTLHKKSTFYLVAHKLYCHLFWSLAMTVQLVQRVLRLLRGEFPIRPEFLLPPALASVAVLCATLPHTASMPSALLTGLGRYAFMSLVSSYSFVGIGLIAAHHDTDIWHEGDLLTNRDWGVLQVAATRDRPGIDRELLFVVCSFGQHVLHHLFPTVDHSKLCLLQPVLARTCQEFGIEQGRYKKTQLSLATGLFRQLERAKGVDSNDIVAMTQPREHDD